MNQLHMQQAMGGPVGGGVAPMNPGTPSTGPPTTDLIKKLNTAIYDYLLCTEKYDAARVVFKHLECEVATGMKQSPSQRGNQPNGVDAMDGDGGSSHAGIKGRPSDLPEPVSLSNEDSPFLQDWWVQFWEIYWGNRQKAKPTVLNYVGQQRNQQKVRTGMMGADANVQRQQYNMMNNGGNGDLRQAAMKNGMNPQQHQQMLAMRKMQAAQAQAQGQMAGAQMERQGSQMDMSGQRGSGSPNNGGDAPSPKRQRLEGNMQQMNQARPGQPGQMQGGNQGMPPNPAMGPGGAQSSPMSQQGFDGPAEAMYPNRMGMPQNGAAVAAGGQPTANNGNHALQDYQMQLMLLEQQNKKRLLMARQEQDSMANPSGVPGSNGQFQPGMSPQGSRAGDPSPNPNDMQRGTPNMRKPGMSPNGDMTGRGSPNPGMIDPSAMNPQMRNQMIMGPNGQPLMRPPSSHPGMTAQQMEMMRQQGGGMMPNGQQWQGAPQGPPGQMMPQQPGQPSNMTPRQGNMPPPPAPGPNAAGTQPSSPAQAPAPPTPSQTSKPKPGGKKEAAKKGGANKKGAASGANEEVNAPPTPTPPPPVTPNNAASFNQNKQMQIANGQPPPGQQNLNNGQSVQPAQPEMNLQPFGNDLGDQFGSMDFASIDTGDVLDNFDFDSFLNNTGGDEGLGFDANFAFGDGAGEIDIGN